jgi:hypothetical protein
VIEARIDAPTSGVEPEPAEVHQREQDREEQRAVPAERLPRHHQTAQRDLAAHLGEQAGRDEAGYPGHHDRGDQVRQAELEQQQPDQRRGGRGRGHQPDDEHLDRGLYPLVVGHRGDPDGLYLAAHPLPDAPRALRLIRPVFDVHHDEALTVSDSSLNGTFCSSAHHVPSVRASCHHLVFVI